MAEVGPGWTDLSTGRRSFRLAPVAPPALGGLFIRRMWGPGPPWGKDEIWEGKITEMLRL